MIMIFFLKIETKKKKIFFLKQKKSEPSTTKLVG